MGKKTIAEHVGDEETVRLLTGLGVDYGQGYHLGPPAALNGTQPAAASPNTTTHPPPAPSRHQA